MRSTGPVTMLVAYAGDTSTSFDRRHWIDVHLPLVRECWGPHGLDSVAGFFPDGDGGGFVALATCLFRDEAAMYAALASPEGGRVMADVRNVTEVQPRRSVVQPL